MSRGSALLETLAIGFIVAAVVLQIVATAARLQTAGEQVTEAAQVAAAWAARYGDAEGAAGVARDLAPGATVSVQQGPDRIAVIVHAGVPLLGPGIGPLRRSVTGRATAEISPYRSHR